MTQQLNTPAGSSRKLTYEEFLEWDGENQHVEWVDGQVITMAPVGDSHQDLRGFLFALLRILVKQLDLGVVRDDPFQMKTGPGLPGRAPDIFYVRKERISLFKKVYFDGPADLVIEIISPGSRTVDRRDKFREYEVGGVAEYWILDPERKKADFFHRGEDGKYASMPVGADGTYRSLVIEPFWIRVDWLWQKPLPAEFAVFKEWGLF
jgi:Uma2 family endonuclease